jgi:hypothetical protein
MELKFLRKLTKVSIVSNGYSDRYVMHNSEIELSINGIILKMPFLSDHDTAESIIEILGLERSLDSFGKACTILKDMPTYYFTEYTTPFSAKESFQSMGSSGNGKVGVHSADKALAYLTLQIDDKAGLSDFELHAFWSQLTLINEKHQRQGQKVVKIRNIS